MLAPFALPFAEHTNSLECVEDEDEEVDEADDEVVVVRIMMWCSISSLAASTLSTWPWISKTGWLSRLGVTM